MMRILKCQKRGSPWTKNNDRKHKQKRQTKRASFNINMEKRHIEKLKKIMSRSFLVEKRGRVFFFWQDFPLKIPDYLFT